MRPGRVAIEPETRRSKPFHSLERACCWCCSVLHKQASHIGELVSKRLLIQRVLRKSLIAGGARDPKQKDGLWERLNELSSDLPVVGLLEGEQRPDNSALGVNAFDYIQRPFDEDATLDTVQRALQAARETQTRPPTVPLPALNEVLVRSPAMRATMSLVERAAPSDATVMIRGESGTGKEVVARRLHELSGRAKGPLIKVHCAALPEQIL